MSANRPYDQDAEQTPQEADKPYLRTSEQEVSQQEKEAEILQLEEELRDIPEGEHTPQTLADEYKKAGARHRQLVHDLYFPQMEEDEFDQRYVEEVLPRIIAGQPGVLPQAAEDKPEQPQPEQDEDDADQTGLRLGLTESQKEILQEIEEKLDQGKSERAQLLDAAARVREELEKRNAQASQDTQAEKPEPEFRIPAVWRNRDVDEPIVVTGFAGEKDGRQYVNVEGSNTAIPADEVIDVGRVPASAVTSEPQQPEPKPEPEREAEPAPALVAETRQPISWRNPEWVKDQEQRKAAEWRNRVKVYAAAQDVIDKMQEDSHYVPTADEIVALNNYEHQQKLDALRPGDDAITPDDIAYWRGDVSEWRKQPVKWEQGAELAADLPTAAREQPEEKLDDSKPDKATAESLNMIDTADAEAWLGSARLNLARLSARLVNRLGFGKKTMREAEADYEAAYLAALEKRIAALKNVNEGITETELAQYVAVFNANERALLTDHRLESKGDSRVNKFLDSYRRLSWAKKFGVGAIVSVATAGATVAGAPVLLAAGVGVGTRGALSFGSRFRKSTVQEEPDSFGATLDKDQAQQFINDTYKTQGLPKDGLDQAAVAAAARWQNRQDVNQELRKQQKTAAGAAATTGIAIAGGRVLGNWLADIADDLFDDSNELPDRPEGSPNHDGKVTPAELRQQLEALNNDNDPTNDVDQAVIEGIRDQEDVEAFGNWLEATQDIAERENITADEAAAKLYQHLEGVEQYGEPAVEEYYDSLSNVPEYPDGANFPVDATTLDENNYIVTGIDGSRVSHMTGAAEAAYREYFIDHHQPNDLEVQELVNELIRERKKKGLSVLLTNGERLGISRAQIEAALERAARRAP